MLRFLLLLLLRVLLLVALTMSLEDAKANEELSQLVVRLPQAKNVTEVFSVFAEHIEQVFQGLMHASLLLLPREGQASADKSTAKPRPQDASSEVPLPMGSGDLPADMTNQQSSAEQRAWDFVEKVLAFRAGCDYDWTNCCVFNIFKGRGPVVQLPPPWPLSCTASYCAVVKEETLSTHDYATAGPHFLDWKALHEKGARSMVVAPMFSCNKPVAVLCLASSNESAFERLELVQLLSSVLAPYVQLLEYSSRRMEMQKLVNDIITPIAAQLAQQKQSQLSRLGCFVEEDTSGEKLPANGTGKGVQTSLPKRRVQTQSHHSQTQSRGSTNLKVTCSSLVGADKAAEQQPNGSSDKLTSMANTGSNGNGSGSTATCIAARQKPTIATATKRGEPAIGKHHAFSEDYTLGPPPDVDLDWGDFFFNLVSMCIVYVYFSKAAVAGESLIAILLCMGVAAFDIVLLVMRWLWFEHYVHYGTFVLHIFQVYRVVVLPVANTWMSWSLLNKMELTPGTGVSILLGLLLIGCVLLGIQIRFFLHAPLQLASVLFAASSTTDLCNALFASTGGLGCIGLISALQLSLGLLLPSLLLVGLEARHPRTFVPHVQAKRWLLHP